MSNCKVIPARGALPAGSVFIDLVYGDNTPEGGFSSLPNAFTYLENLGAPTGGTKYQIFLDAGSNGQMYSAVGFAQYVNLIGYGKDYAFSMFFDGGGTAILYAQNCFCSSLTFSSATGVTVNGTNLLIGSITRNNLGGVEYSGTVQINGTTTIQSTFDVSGFAGTPGVPGTEATYYTDSTAGLGAGNGSNGLNITLAQGVISLCTVVSNGGAGGTGGQGGGGVTPNMDGSEGPGSDGGPGGNGGNAGNLTVENGCCIAAYSLNAGALGPGGAGGGSTIQTGNPGTDGSAGTGGTYTPPTWGFPLS